MRVSGPTMNCSGVSFSPVSLGMAFNSLELKRKLVASKMEDLVDETLLWPDVADTLMEFNSLFGADSVKIVQYNYRERTWDSLTNSGWYLAV